MKKIKLIKRIGNSISRTLILGVALIAGILSMSTSDVNAQSGNCVKGEFSYTVDNYTVKFHAKTSGPVLLTYWYFDNQLIGKGDNIKFTFKKAGEYKVCLVVLGYDTANQQRCKFEYCHEVEVKDTCNLEAKIYSKTDGKKVLFEGSANSRSVKYYWRFGDGDDAHGKVARHEYAKNGSYKVCLLVKDTISGCTTQVCREIKINDCDLQIAFDHESKDLNAVFEAKANSRNVVYFWNFGDGKEGKGRVVRHEYPKAGYYEVCLTAVDTVNHCKERICKKIEISKNCDLQIAFEHKSDSLKAIFEAKANSRNAVFHWNFGDGEDGNGRVIRHKYDSAGVYEVCLTVVDTVTKCRERVCRRILIGKDCDLEAKFGYKLDSNLLKLEATSNSKTTVYYWNFGDEKEGKGRLARHEYHKSGKYEVCLIAVDTANKCRVRVCRVIEVDLNDCDLRAEFGFRIDGNLVVFEGKSNSDSARYIWNFGDSTDGKGRLIRHQYKDGSYRVCLTVIDKTEKCKVTVCKKIEIKKCDIEVGFKYEKDSAKYIFKARSNKDKVRYVWSFGDGGVATGEVARHEYDKPGRYTVCVTAVDLISGCTKTKCEVIVVRPKCDLKADFVYSVYPSGKVRFISQVNDKQASIRWYFGDGKTDSGRKPAHRYKKTGRYTVCMVVESKNGCKEKICKTIFVKVPHPENNSDDHRNDDKFDHDNNGNHNSQDDVRKEKEKEHKLTVDDWQIHLAPNPVSGNAKVTIEGEVGSRVEVISMTGAVLRSVEMKGTSAELYLGDLERGYYFIKVTSENNSVKQIKFLRQ